MSKADDLATALRKLREQEAALAPQPGMFSVLDELIQQAPFERAPADQWRGYLQPGRMLKREDTQFPLKSEEIEYAGLNRLRADAPLTKERLREFVSDQRPSFKSVVTREEYADGDLYSLAGRKSLADRYDVDVEGYPSGRRASTPPSDPRYGSQYEAERLLHEPVDGAYEENVTSMMGLDRRGHFDNDALSWGRATVHETPIGKVRLVEEIQSDLHQAARKKVRGTDERVGYVPRDNTEIDALTARERELREQLNGSLDPADRLAMNEESLSINDRLKQIERAEPDAPFKETKDYAGLELKKQLLDAVTDGDDYLALTTGKDQAERYSLHGDRAKGTSDVYDKIYLGEMRKLAKRFGAKVENVEFEVSSGFDARPEELIENSAEDFYDYIGMVGEDMTDGVVGEFSDITNSFRNMYREMKNRTDGRRTHSSDKIEDALAEIDDLFDEMKDALGEDAWTAKLNDAVLIPYLNRYSSAGQRFADGMQDLMELATPETTTVTKSFPAIKLTPEIREKIKKIGVPLWAAAGAAAIPEEEEPQTFSKGGRVRELAKKLREQARDPESEKMVGRLERLQRLAEEIPELEIYVRQNTANKSPVIEARLGDELVGMMTLRPEAELAYPSLVQVKKPYEGKGIGSAMYLEAARRLKEEGKRLHASTNRSPEAKRLWEKFPVATEKPPWAPRRLVDDAPDETYLDYAEGGEVKEPSLKWLRSAAHSLSNQIPFVSDETRDYVGDTLAHVPSGLMSQTHGVNPKTGELEFGWDDVAMLAANPMLRFNPEFMDNFTLPGIVDETMALPMLGEIFGLEAPEISRAASSRADVTRSKVREEMGLDDPEGFPQHFADAAGMMGGQVPVPSSIYRGLRAPVEGALKKLKKFTAGIPSSAAEFLSPIVEPGVGSILAGGAFGGVLGTALEPGEESPVESLLDSFHAGDPEAEQFVEELVGAYERGDEEAKKILAAITSVARRRERGRAARESMVERGPQGF